MGQLRGALALLSPENAWWPNRSAGAVDGAGTDCPVRSPDAVRFGVLGALTRLDEDPDERLDAVDLLCRAVGAKHLYAWEQEPGRTQGEVLEAIRRAIAIGSDGGRP